VTIAPKMRACCLTGRGPGGVKFDSTNPAPKIGITGCPFVSGGSADKRSAASPEGAQCPPARVIVAVTAADTCKSHCRRTIVTVIAMHHRGRATGRAQVTVPEVARFLRGRHFIVL